MCDCELLRNNLVICVIAKFIPGIMLFMIKSQNLFFHIFAGIAGGSCLLNGVKREFPDARTFVEDGRDIWMKLEVKGRESRFKWSLDGENYAEIGRSKLLAG